MGEMESLKKLLNPQEILFIADSMTGQDAVKSADEFHKRLALTGIILTKMDGDARGGAALSIRHVTGQPVKFIGMGEKPDAGFGSSEGKEALDKYHSGTYCPSRVTHELDGVKVLDLTITEGWANPYVVFPDPELLAKAQ